MRCYDLKDSCHRRQYLLQLGMLSSCGRAMKTGRSHFVRSQDLRAVPGCRNGEATMIPLVVAVKAVLGLSFESHERCTFPGAVGVTPAAWVHLQSAALGSTLAGALGTVVADTQAMTVAA